MVRSASDTRSVCKGQQPDPGLPVVGLHSIQQLTDGMAPRFESSRGRQASPPLGEALPSAKNSLPQAFTKVRVQVKNQDLSQARLKSSGALELKSQVPLFPQSKIESGEHLLDAAPFSFLELFLTPSLKFPAAIEMVPFAGPIARPETGSTLRFRPDIVRS